eukprot:CAMPEP_0203646898 /NCGR_PEP_ID=MMETSP0088-20131115/14135_1 /ASSEMBLY_ACC=CAM_ASM_001087 /TAXON_ID=426623 /ORGANISM="Chaetoceros affinis, Strain CCMP159" /LENGTH=45 /DNA_ID= /DNA_START= /DNA_END= /DNA_ORIENTATION=
MELPSEEDGGGDGEVNTNNSAPLFLASALEPTAEEITLPIEATLE